MDNTQILSQNNTKEGRTLQLLLFLFVAFFVSLAKIYSLFFFFLARWIADIGSSLYFRSTIFIGVARGASKYFSRYKKVTLASFCECQFLHSDMFPATKFAHE
jgi:hypothetical protein